MTDATLIIFDCDGVLVDSEPLANAVLHAELARLGDALSLAESTALFTGLSLPSCTEIIRRRLGRPPPADFLPRLRSGVAAAFRRDLAPVAGVEAVLQGLDRPYCVASSGSHEKIRFSLGLTGLEHFFPPDRIFSADDVVRGKPAPDLFLHAAGAMGFHPGNCVVVEDSRPGVTAARAAGMAVLAFAGRGEPQSLREAGAEVVFTSMDELPALLRASAPGA